MVVSEQREEYSLNPCLSDSTSTRGMKQFFFRLKDDYSGFNETNFSMRTAKLPAHEAAGGGRGSGTDDYGVHRFLSCSCLSYSKELWGASISKNSMTDDSDHSRNIVLLSPFHPPLLSSTTS